jgi:hypothetical protein
MQEEAKCNRKENYWKTKKKKRKVNVNVSQYEQFFFHKNS